MQAALMSRGVLLGSCMGEHGRSWRQGILLIGWGSRVVVAGNAEVWVHLEQMGAARILYGLIGHLVGHSNQTFCESSQDLEQGMCDDEARLLACLSISEPTKHGMVFIRFLFVVWPRSFHVSAVCTMKRSGLAYEGQRSCCFNY